MQHQIPHHGVEYGYWGSSLRVWGQGVFTNLLPFSPTYALNQKCFEKWSLLKKLKKKTVCLAQDLCSPHYLTNSVWRTQRSVDLASFPMYFKSKIEGSGPCTEDSLHEAGGRIRAWASAPWKTGPGWLWAVLGTTRYQPERFNAGQDMKAENPQQSYR